MTSLELKLLGGFQAQLSSGLTFAPPTRKSRALLAYLALHPDKAQSREELVAVLWSERAGRQGAPEGLADLDLYLARHGATTGIGNR